MSNRQLVKLASCICLLPLFFSCSSERDEGSEGSGTLHVQVNANPEVVVGTNTQGGDGTEQGVPDVNDFSFSIFKGETLRGEWATLTDFLADDELMLRPGNDYLAVAAYGDVDKEGFGLPYYEGSQSFAIMRGVTTEVELTCRLGNSKLAIAYTDAFKDYFSDYAAEVSTSQGYKVEYAAGEERYGYFKPGDLAVSVKAKKKEGYTQMTTFNVKNFKAEACHAYVLTLDVDAGAASLKVSFSDDIPNQEPVTIEVSDEALSAPVPYFKANGFDTEQPMTIVEGKSAEASEVYAYLHAPGGIARCLLTTRSASLIEQGWPETVDLTDIPAEALDAMKRLGLQLAGLGDKKDKIAKIDFTNVIPFLEYIDEETEHVFELRATDRLAKETPEPLQLRVRSTDNRLALAAADVPVAYGSSKVTVKLTLDGDPEKVTYWLRQGETVRRVAPCSITSDGVSHELVFKLNESQYADIQLEARYLRRTIGCHSVVETKPEVKLSIQYPGDVWAHSATLQSEGECEGWVPQYAKVATGESVWNSDNSGVSASAVSFAKLAAGTKYFCRLAKMDEEGDVIETSNAVVVETEKELQVPNAGFEEWHEKFVWKGTSTTGGDVDMYTFYPYKESEQDSWWSTRNDMTTAKNGAGDFSYYYVVYPGTVPLASTWAAVGKIGYPAQALEGENSAEISTIGWGKNSTCTTGLLGNKMDCKKKTAGALFIGTFANGKEEHGHTFESRPTQMSFAYRLRSYNNEQASASIRIEHREGEEITLLGSGELQLNGNVNTVEGEIGTVDITYVNETLLPTHISILFLSSTASTPGYTPYYVKENFKGNRYSRAIGNVLVIDNVNLKYEK